MGVRMASLLVMASIGIAGCTDSFHSEMPEYHPDIAPEDFVAGIDHPFLPFIEGATWTYYVGTPDDFEERIEVVVLTEPKTIQGVHATVVRDTVYDAEGELIEDTFDWYAQDTSGNVWYLGEETCEYDGGACVSTAGSFEWGVDGALPGISMHADPHPGDPYYQEYYPGVAMDRAQVMSKGEVVTTPIGTFGNTVRTQEWNPLLPDVAERVVYVHGIGPVIKGEYDDDAREFDAPEILYAYDVPGYGAVTA